MLVPGLHPLTPVQRMQNKGQARVYDLVVSPESHPLSRLPAGSPSHPQGGALSPPGWRGPTPATPPPTATGAGVDTCLDPIGEGWGLSFLLWPLGYEAGTRLAVLLACVGEIGTKIPDLALAMAQVNSPLCYKADR